MTTLGLVWRFLNNYYYRIMQSGLIINGHVFYSVLKEDSLKVSLDSCYRKHPSPNKKRLNCYLSEMI